MAGERRLEPPLAPVCGNSRGKEQVPVPAKVLSMSITTFRTLGLAGVAWLAALHAVPAAAEDYCVSSTAQLRTAISAAAASAEDDVIKLVRGNFPLNSTLQGDFNGGLVLRGGYGEGCPALGRSLDAPQTRIYGSPVQGALVTLRARDGDVEIDGISFEDLYGVQIIDEGADVATGRVWVRRSRFLGNAFGLSLLLRSMDVRVENNLFIDNRSLCCGSETLNVGLAVRHAQTDAPEIAVSVLFNTVIGSPKGILIQGGGAFSSAPLLQNNIMRSSVVANGTFALKLDAARVSATNNIWGEILTEDGGGLLANVLNVDADPELDASFVPISGSPALNSGTDFVTGGVPATDYDGGPRIIGSRPDRGALERAISDIGIITVTSTDNSGAGTLRQAILDSNQTVNAEVIRFNLGAAGGCPYFITPTSLLPAVTSPLTIDGFSQPGSVPNSERSSDNSERCVILNGSLAQGLRLRPPAERQMTVRGIAFYGFSTAAIDVDGEGSAVIEGNGFGLGALALATGFDGDAILVTDAPGTRIGGADESQRNLIGRASGAGVRLIGAGERTVRNNFIGISQNGYGTVANRIGIHITDAREDRIEDNAIGHNLAQGILVDDDVIESVDVTIIDNTIGRSPTRNPDNSIEFRAGNGTNGIRIASGIGHELASNIVAYNDTDGIVVLGNRTARINANRIYGNAQLGIDLSPNGVDNQNSDQVIGDRGNAGQNYPVLQTAIGSNGAGVVTGQLPSSTGQFTLQLFASRSCDETGYGEGEAIIGTGSASISGVPVPGGGTLPIDSSAAFSIPVTSAFANFGLIGSFITATATRNGTTRTSEFSACIPYETGPQIFFDGFED